MPAKTIKIDIDAYERLRHVKREGESFSELIKRSFAKPIDPEKWLADLAKTPPYDDDFLKAMDEVVASRGKRRRRNES